MKWYIIRAKSNCEDKAVELLKKEISKNKKDDFFGEIIVPKQESYEMKKGKKVKVAKRIYPGYVLVKMNLTPETFSLVKNIKHVSGFLSTDPLRPTPLAESEVSKFLKLKDDGFKDVSPSTTYANGDNVKILSGPFKGMVGVVEDVSKDHKKVKINVMVFGRATPVDIDVSELTK